MQRGDAAPAYTGSSGVDDLFTDLRSGEILMVIKGPEAVVRS